MLISPDFYRLGQCILPTLVLTLWLASVPAASAHSRFQMLKVQLLCVSDSQQQHTDSLARSLPGVFSTSWYPRRQLLVVVYDRQVTRRKTLKRMLGIANVRAERREKNRKGIQ